MITEIRKKELDEKAEKLAKELTTNCYFTIYPGYTEEEIEYVASTIESIRNGVMLSSEEKELIEAYIDRFNDLIEKRAETFEVKGTESVEDFFTAKVIGNKSVVIYVPMNKTKLVWNYIIQNYDCTLSRKLMDDAYTKFWLNTVYDHRLKEYIIRKVNKYL